MGPQHRSGAVVNRTVEYRSRRRSRLWGYAAKVYWHKAHGQSCSAEKGATAPFSCLPARTGSGRARFWVKGLVPCGFSGQSPEPSESFLISISAIFKVLLSLIFSTHFFITYLTLPTIIIFVFSNNTRTELWITYFLCNQSACISASGSQKMLERDQKQILFGLPANNTEAQDMTKTPDWT